MPTFQSAAIVLAIFFLVASPLISDEKLKPPMARWVTTATVAVPMATALFAVRSDAATDAFVAATAVIIALFLSAFAIKDQKERDQTISWYSFFGFASTAIAAVVLWVRGLAEAEGWLAMLVLASVMFLVWVVFARSPRNRGFRAWVAWIMVLASAFLVVLALEAGRLLK